MSQDHPGRKGDKDPRDCRPPTPEGGCDPSAGIDQRACQDAGLTARLAYTKDHSEALATAQGSYQTARTSYREKRHDAALTVQDLKHQVKHTIERIKCLIEQERVVRCLDEAFGQVCGWLDCCEGPVGCCVDEVDFGETPPSNARKLAHRIERYQAQVDAAQACFDTLVAEPDKLEERVKKAGTTLQEIITALAGDAAAVDLKKEYAKALVLRRTLERIWNGFADNNAYIECLCHALETWSRGVEVISILVGAKAVLECEQGRAKDWCDKLVAAPVDEILVIYDRCICDQPCGSDQPEDPPGNHPEDCGCGKHEQDTPAPEPSEAS